MNLKPVATPGAMLGENGTIEINVLFPNITTGGKTDTQFEWTLRNVLILASWQ